MNVTTMQGRLKMIEHCKPSLINAIFKRKGIDGHTWETIVIQDIIQYRICRKCGELEWNNYGSWSPIDYSDLQIIIRHEEQKRAYEQNSRKQALEALEIDPSER